MRAALTGAIAAAGVLLSAPGATAAVAPSDPCPAAEFRTASGCRSLSEAGREVEDIVRQALVTDDLRAVLLRIDAGDRTIAATSPGESMAGVPASLRMRFRIGSMAIPYLIDLLLQLQDRGRLSLDEPLSSYLPEYPNADRVTLRNLAHSISGYPDWAQGNDAFIDAFLADVFRQWTTQELLDVAFSQPLICDPATCFHYAHTNFAILAQVVRGVTGQSITRLIRNRIFAPLGLRQTRISGLPGIPEPVLHAYSSDRGPYEDSTYWSPSWGLPKTLLMTATIGDVIKSAKALGTGALVSRAASRQRFAPTTAGLAPFSPGRYFGLGVVVVNSWAVQNPVFNGYRGIMAYLPSRRISLALEVTAGPNAAANDVNYSERLFQSITEYLTPTFPAELPG